MTQFAVTTSVSANASREEIERTLARYGADQFLYGWQDASALVGFRMHNLHVKFVLAISSTVSAVGDAINNITSDSGDDAEGVSVALISTGSPVRIDVAFEAYRTSGASKLKAQLVCRRQGQPDLILSGQYNAPTSVDSPPVVFFVVSTIGTGAVTFFVKFSVDGGGSWNVLTQTICATEIKR